jgi:hypothetical protein
MMTRQSRAAILAGMDEHPRIAMTASMANARAVFLIPVSSYGRKQSCFSMAAAEIRWARALLKSTKLYICMLHFSTQRGEFASLFSHWLFQLAAKSQAAMSP